MDTEIENIRSPAEKKRTKFVCPVADCGNVSIFIEIFGHQLILIELYWHVQFYYLCMELLIYTFN